MLSWLPHTPGWPSCPSRALSAIEAGYEVFVVTDASGNVTTAQSDSSRRTVSAPISAWMGGLWTLAARPIGYGEASSSFA
jgi:hypothetical protein